MCHSPCPLFVDAYKNVSQLFKIADKDGSGTIDKQELKDALNTIGFTHLGDAAVRHCRL